MNRLAFAAMAPFVLAGPAAAQSMDHAAMPGMVMPGDPPKAPAKPAAAAPPHTVPASTPATAPEAMSGMSMPATPPSQDAATPAAAGEAPDQVPAAAEIPHGPPPPAPSDRAADLFFPPAAMAAARAQLQREHGAGTAWKVMANLAEYQARAGADGYRWDGQAWFGGDIHRLVFKSEGEGTRGQGVEAAELQALYSRAVGVYTDLQVGVRQDFEPRARTYATVGFETLLPYWFDLEGAAFLSDRGELLGRLEGLYDLRLTNRLILQPRAELNFAAQDTAATRTGSGLSNAELGLRLRYEIRRTFAPYVGVSWDRKLGRTADYARADGGDVEATSLVVGVRAFY
jgi:copper resistance protein B